MNFSNVGTIIIVIISLVLIFALLSIAMLWVKYAMTKRKLMNPDHRETGDFNDPFLDETVKDFKTANKSKLAVNTYAIVESNLSKHWGLFLFAERFQRTAVSLMIILGLMGTFFGLTLSVDRLVNLLGNLDNLSDIIPTMASSVEGMAIAFNTSLFGIGGSVILTVVRMVVSIEQKREDITIYIEDYLDNVIAKHFAEEKFNEYDKLVHAMENVFKEFGTQITLTFSDVVKTSTEKIDNSSEAITMLTSELKETVSKFEKSMATFSDNTRDLGEFNYHLRDNIQRMSLTFSDFSESLEPETKVITEETIEV